MDAVPADDFIEFGRSGLRYTREDVMPTERDTAAFEAALHGIAYMPIGSECALVTYLSEVRNEREIEWANRSSLWDKSSGTWKLRFHQGTPTQEPL